MRDIAQLLERWHALWLLAQGWTALAVAEALYLHVHDVLDSEAIVSKIVSEYLRAKA